MVPNRTRWIFAYWTTVNVVKKIRNMDDTKEGTPNAIRFYTLRMDEIANALFPDLAMLGYSNSSKGNRRTTEFPIPYATITATAVNTFTFAHLGNSLWEWPHVFRLTLTKNMFGNYVPFPAWLSCCYRRVDVTVRQHDALSNWPFKVWCPFQG